MSKLPKRQEITYKYGKLPEKVVITVPWQVLCTDCIGPYSVKDVRGRYISIYVCDYDRSRNIVVRNERNTSYDCN